VVKITLPSCLILFIVLAFSHPIQTDFYQTKRNKIYHDIIKSNIKNQAAKHKASRQSKQKPMKSIQTKQAKPKAEHAP